ncbi:unnamed protein product [Symbiodinium natans]|uniref:Endonuclease/exonuclease/phosphatase domain-containing protein n=1 Tax=Symbiodinium natans TaxID=878477 RepID=A0A812JHE2_9DINO|nr:unnamed protein product [Symbiodinium natans]
MAADEGATPRARVGAAPKANGGKRSQASRVAGHVAAGSESPSSSADPGPQDSQKGRSISQIIELAEARNVERLVRTPRSQHFPMAREGRADTDQAHRKHAWAHREHVWTRREHACACVCQGQLSRTSQVLAGGVLAPGDDASGPAHNACQFFSCNWDVLSDDSLLRLVLAPQEMGNTVHPQMPTCSTWQTLPERGNEVPSGRCVLPFMRDWSCIAAAAWRSTRSSRRGKSSKLLVVGLAGAPASASAARSRGEGRGGWVRASGIADEAQRKAEGEWHPGWLLQCLAAAAGPQWGDAPSTASSSLSLEEEELLELLSVVGVGGSGPGTGGACGGAAASARAGDWTDGWQYHVPPLPAASRNFAPPTNLLARRAKGIASASDSTHGEAAVGGSRLPARVGEQGGLRLLAQKARSLLARITAPYSRASLRHAERRKRPHADQAAQTLRLQGYEAPTWAALLEEMAPPNLGDDDGPLPQRGDGAEVPLGDLLLERPQRLLVLGNEVGGRWNDQARDFLRTLTRLRGYRAPAAVRRSAASGWARRWWGLLSVAVQVAVADCPNRGWIATRRLQRGTSFVDTTLVSALGFNGRPLMAAKQCTYPELLRSLRCRLVVLAIELGGRWSRETALFIRHLARAAPSLRNASVAAFTARWFSLLAFAAARVWASSFLSLHLPGAANVDGAAPDVSEVLTGQRFYAVPPRQPHPPPVGHSDRHLQTQKGFAMKATVALWIFSQVASYNLYWWCISDEFGTCPQWAGGSGFQPIFSRIQENAPLDLIGFQECSDIGRVIWGAGLGSTFDFFTPPPGNDAPMAWQKSKFFAVDGPATMWIARDMYGDRNMNWVRLKVIGSGATIFFANTHGPLGQCWGGPGFALADSIIKAVYSHKQPQDQMVFTGDFNCDGNSDTIKKLAQVFELAATDNSFGGADHIFSNWGMKVVWTGSNNGWPSDHQLLKAVLEPPPAAGYV